MNFRNNIYAEAMLAHFHNFFYYHNQDTTPPTDNDNETPPLAGGYPPDFFDMFYTLNANSLKDPDGYSSNIEEQLLSKIGEFPILEGIKPPKVKYNYFLGIKLNLKRITVPHPDGRVTTLTYRYHFYKLKYVVKYFLEKDLYKRVEIYNHHLKERRMDVYPDSNAVLYFRDGLSEIMGEYSQNEYTRKRQCLAILYLLEVSGVNLDKVNLSDVARFAHLLSAKDIPLGRSQKEIIGNSTIYKMLKNVKNQMYAPLDADLIFIKNIISPLAEEHNSSFLKKLCKRLIIK